MSRPAAIGGHTPADQCANCSTILCEDDIAITKRLIGRGLTRFLCRHCLAGMLHVSTDAITQKIEQYRSMGCTLFR